MQNLLRHFDRYCASYAPYKGGAWCYEDGCIYRGLDLLAAATGDVRWHAHLRRLIDAQVAPDGALAGYDAEGFNIDNILPGRVLFGLARDTGDPRYMVAAARLIGQLDRHPRTATGNYWHKARYPHQLWLDGLYMALPFQIEYALATGEQRRVSDALQQLSTALDLTATPGGLHVHGHDASHAQAWADAVTGQSPAVWARAMGWLAMALVDALVILPDDAATHALRQRTAAILVALAQRQGASGLWPQVLDAPELAGNYDESSATAMFAYAFLRAARLGLVTGAEAAGLRGAGLRALRVLEQTRMTEHGLAGICRVAGLGTLAGRYRDGTPAYYLTEDVVAGDAKGMGPLMMASAEAAFPGQPDGLGGLPRRRLSGQPSSQ
ncbi:glycoside hydrolase family 88/105 protein [Fertoeibacter niger]|nr:glycoside hydrolase family 88 protein [Fertoeibacter niger]